MTTQTGQSVGAGEGERFADVRVEDLDQLVDDAYGSASVRDLNPETFELLARVVSARQKAVE